eukprot:9105103-Pyramimonas_sp.AAC.1
MLRGGGRGGGRTKSAITAPTRGRPSRRGPIPVVHIEVHDGNRLRSIVERRRCYIPSCVFL